LPLTTTILWFLGATLTIVVLEAGAVLTTTRLAHELRLNVKNIPRINIKCLIVYGFYYKTLKNK
jgi:hypothetical protein